MSLVDTVSEIQKNMLCIPSESNFISYEEKYLALHKAGLIKKKGPRLASLDEIYRRTSNTYFKIEHQNLTQEPWVSR